MRRRDRCSALSTGVIVHSRFQLLGYRTSTGRLQHRRNFVSSWRERQELDQNRCAIQFFDCQKQTWRESRFRCRTHVNYHYHAFQTPFFGIEFFAGIRVCTDAKCPETSLPTRKAPFQADRHLVFRYAKVLQATMTPGNTCTAHCKRREKRNRSTMQGISCGKNVPMRLKGQRSVPIYPGVNRYVPWTPPQSEMNSAA